MKKKIDEAERIRRYKAQRKKFSYNDHAKGIMLVKKAVLKDVHFEFDRYRFEQLKCYLYHFDKLGVTAKEMEETFEGKTILIYKSIKRKPVIMTRRKCPWCYAPTNDFIEHIRKVHGKTKHNVFALRFQKDLYTELLRIIRETEYYMSLAFLNRGCQLCDDPVMPGRELCCSIPTSFRDRMRSLKFLNITTSNIDPKYFENNKYGQIVLLP